MEDQTLGLRFLLSLRAQQLLYRERAKPGCRLPRKDVARRPMNTTVKHWSRRAGIFLEAEDRRRPGVL